jgi:hypothetical protein
MARQAVCISHATGSRWRLPIRRRRLLLVSRSSSGTLAHHAPGACGGGLPPFVSAVVGRIKMIPSPVSVRKPPRFRGKSWKHRRPPIARKPLFSRTFLGSSGSHVLLAMQKVEGSNSLQPLSGSPYSAITHTSLSDNDLEDDTRLIGVSPVKRCSQAT